MGRWLLSDHRRECDSPHCIACALLNAEAHVVRQQSHGRHEQDRADAIAWVGRFGGLMHSIRYPPHDDETGDTDGE